MAPKWDEGSYKDGYCCKHEYPYMHHMCGHPYMQHMGHPYMHPMHDMDCMPKMEDECCPPMPCEMPMMKCKTEKECVKTFKSVYKLYKVCKYRLYKVCPRCGHEFDHHFHHGMCPKCGIGE